MPWLSKPISRNSAVAGTSRARPSGSSANASVTRKPNSDGEQKCRRVNASLSGNRDERLQRSARAERHQHADDEADCDAYRRDGKHLDQIDRKDESARGAEALEGGDDAALAVEIGAHGVGDADAADDQRGQADQGQELRKPFDIRGERRRGIAAIADAPAGVGKFLCARDREWQ